MMGKGMVHKDESIDPIVQYGRRTQYGGACD